MTEKIDSYRKKEIFHRESERRIERDSMDMCVERDINLKR